MSTYFAWIHPGEEYDPQAHSREDLKIFRLTIQEKEGTYPHARLLIQKPENPLPEGKEGLLSQDQQVLFRGRVLKTPVKISEDLVEIKLIAKPIDGDAKLHRLCERLKSQGCWDPLFVGKDREDIPGEVIQGRSQLFFWSRTDGSVRPSDLFNGSKKATLGKSILKDSLRYALSHCPLDSIHLEISAQWIQEYQGTHNLAPFFRFQFPEGIVNTLTGALFEKNWWKPNQRIGRSGYTLKKSKIKRITPPNTGGLNVYPRTSIKLWEGDQPYRLKRTWYQVQDFLVNWTYKQKRREVAHIHLRQHLQDLNTEKRTKRLKIRLQNIASEKSCPQWRAHHRYSRGFCVKYGTEIYQSLSFHTSGGAFDPRLWKNITSKLSPTLKRATFFNTDRGRHAILHGIEVAKSYLAYSARAIEVKVQVPYEKARSLTCDHTLTLKDPRLPGGRVHGKLKHLKLVQDGESGVTYGEMTLACSIGASEVPEATPPSMEFYTEEGYLEDDYTFNDGAVYFTPSRVGFSPWEDQYPVQGLIHPEALASRDILEEIEIINPPRTQTEALQRHLFDGKRSVQQALTLLQTRIRLRLKDLKSTGVLTHHIQIPIKHAYVPPQQIHLKG